jgi:ABC-type transport system substrate-binding protein
MNSKRMFKVFFVSIFVIVCMLGFMLPQSWAQIKELRIGIGIDADTLNPQEHTTTLCQNLSDLIQDNIFYQTPDGKLEPRLATKLEVSKDGLIYTLHLRKGVKFSDGTPFDAKAMKLTFDRTLDPKMRVPLRFSIAMIKEVKIVDDYTLRIELNYAFAPFARTLSLTLCSPISPAAIEK